MVKAGENYPEIHQGDPIPISDADQHVQSLHHGDHFTQPPEPKHGMHTFLASPSAHGQIQLPSLDSSSPIDEALRFIYQLSTGTFHCSHSCEYFSITLSPSEFATLEAHIAADPELHRWTQDKLRANYTEDDNSLLIMMETRLHAMSSRGLEREIEQTLHSEAKPFFDSGNIVKPCAGSKSTVTFPHTSKRKSLLTPDGSFLCLGRKFPTVTMEVGVSQMESDLCEKGTKWIKLSKGQVQAVLCIKIESWDDQMCADFPASSRVPNEPTCRRKVYYWIHRPRQTDTAVDPTETPITVVRQCNGTVHEGFICLKLADFVPPPCPDFDIKISHRRLLGIIDEAERYEEDDRRLRVGDRTGNETVEGLDDETDEETDKDTDEDTDKEVHDADEADDADEVDKGRRGRRGSGGR